MFNELLDDTHRTQLATVNHSLIEEEIVELARTAHAFVAADLAALVQEAAMTALRRWIKWKVLQRDEGTTMCRYLFGFVSK